VTAIIAIKKLIQPRGLVQTNIISMAKRIPHIVERIPVRSRVRVTISLVGQRLPGEPYTYYMYPGSAKEKTDSAL
jgi:hypothetical protein